MRALMLVLLLAGTAAADPLPKLADVKSLALSQGQGGPSIARCNAVVYTIAIDVATNAWTLGICPDKAGPTDSLKITKGKLTDSERKTFDDDYAALDADPNANTCGHDGGTLALVVTTKAGAKTSFVDLNWGCRKPAPVQVAKLKELGSKLLSMFLAKSP